MKTEIETRLKQAMKSKDLKAANVYRNIKAAITESEKGKGETDPMKILQKYVKQRTESHKEYTELGRTDLAEDEMYEIELLSDLLPKALTKEETEAIIDKLIADGNDNIGKVMKAVGQVEGIDRKMVSEILKDKL